MSAKLRLAHVVQTGCYLFTALVALGTLGGGPVLIDRKMHLAWWVGYAVIDGGLLAVFVLVAVVIWAFEAVARG